MGSSACQEDPELELPEGRYLLDLSLKTGSSGAAGSKGDAKDAKSTPGSEGASGDSPGSEQAPGSKGVESEYFSIRIDRSSNTVGLMQGLVTLQTIPFQALPREQWLKLEWRPAFFCDVEVLKLQAEEINFAGYRMKAPHLLPDCWDGKVSAIQMRSAQALSGEEVCSYLPATECMTFASRIRPRP